MVKVLISFALLCSMAFAQFYNTPAEGYYQYSKPKVEEEKRLPEREFLMTMPAEDFQELFTKTLNHALTVRNLETYGDYSTMQEVAFARSEEFAALQVLYAQLHPVANENEYNRTINDRQLEQSISKYLNTNKSEYGLIYFYSRTCPYCAQQEPLLMSFAQRYGWEIEAVEINEKPQIASRFEVTVTPSLRLVDRKQNVWPVSNGLITLPELEERLYRYIRWIKGETSDLDFNKIQ